MKVPFAPPDLTEYEVSAVVAAMRSGWLTTGRIARDFEARFKYTINANHALAVSNATMGALITMDALGIGPGDEVVFPTWTFSGPAMMARKLGAKVVLCDVGDDFMMTPDTLRPALTSRTRLVVPTHFAGKVCDIDALNAMVPGRIFEDAAHAFPARYADARYVGSNFDSIGAVFSFYATKTLTTGEGGMVAVHDARLAAKIARYRSHGISRDAFERYSNPSSGWFYQIVDSGWKANLPDMLAAMGMVQLERAWMMWHNRLEIASAYISGLNDLFLHGKATLPAWDAASAWHLFPIRITHPRISRDIFFDRMKALGVQCSMHFIPLHMHPYWDGLEEVPGPGRPNADRLFLQEASLPIFSSMTSEQVGAVIDATMEALKD